MPRVLIGLGSNLGERDKNLTNAWSNIEKNIKIKTLSLSRFYETKPIGGPGGQPDFLNAAGLISTEIPPIPLLSFLLEIENQMGRVRAEHWGPRVIDLDLLLVEGKVFTSELLTIPHPRMHDRMFVLEPANDICPELIHPLFLKTVGEIFAEIQKKREK